MKNDRLVAALKNEFESWISGHENAGLFDWEVAAQNIIDSITGTQEAPCTAKLYHGPGHHSKTLCRVREPHTVHEAVYGEDQQLARWKDGSYLRELKKAGVTPAHWVDEGTAMTDFFDRLQEEDEDD